MKLGKVTGKLNLEKQAQCLLEEKILLVEMDGSTVAALDRAGAKPGEQVLVVMLCAWASSELQKRAENHLSAIILKGEQENG